MIPSLLFYFFFYLSIALVLGTILSNPYPGQSHQSGLDHLTAAPLTSTAFMSSYYCTLDKVRYLMIAVVWKRYFEQFLIAIFL